MVHQPAARGGGNQYRTSWLVCNGGRSESSTLLESCRADSIAEFKGTQRLGTYLPTWTEQRESRMRCLC